MRVYTVQLGRWRLCQEQGIPLLDTTVKSGDPAFAPSWDIVRGVKGGALSEAAYTQAYYALMRQRAIEHKARWNQVLAMPAVALGCYCAAGVFCHRHLLMGIFRTALAHRGMACTYCGELGNSGDAPSP